MIWWQHLWIIRKPSSFAAWTETLPWYFHSGQRQPGPRIYIPPEDVIHQDQSRTALACSLSSCNIQGQDHSTYFPLTSKAHFQPNLRVASIERLCYLGPIITPGYIRWPRQSTPLQRKSQRPAIAIISVFYSSSSFDFLFYSDLFLKRT